MVTNRKKARIAVFVPSLTGGGAERTAIAIGKALAARGLHVDLVVSNARGELRDDPFVEARLVPLGRRDPLLTIGAYLRYLRTHRPDIVIALVHSANFVAGIGAWAVPGSRTIISVHNTLRKPPKLQWWVRRWFGFWPERLLYRRVTFVQTVSRELADQCRQLLAIDPARLVVTYNSAGKARRRDAIDRKMAEDPFLLSVGRLVPIKGFDVAIRAFAKAALPEPWRLVILGDGPERGRLEAMARELGLSDRIVFTGYVSPTGPWFDRAAGFVLATRGEGFGLVAHEALLADLPIAASRVPGVTEVLGDGRLGRLIDVDDVDGFAQAMRDIVTGALPPPPEPDLSAQLALFDPDAVDQRYADMVENALSAPTGRGR